MGIVIAVKQGARGKFRWFAYSIEAEGAPAVYAASGPIKGFDYAVQAYEHALGVLTAPCVG